jgi:hypothetical protein
LSQGAKAQRIDRSDQKISFCDKQIQGLAASQK